MTPNPPDPFADTYLVCNSFGGRPTNIASTAQQALSRLFVIRGSHFSDPEFSWRFEVAPGAIGFVASRGLGPQFEGDMFMAAARPFLEGGHLFRLRPDAATGARSRSTIRGSADRVADNRHKWEITESETLLIGRNFGVGTDIQTGPNGNVFVVSLTNGAIYEIFRARQR